MLSKENVTECLHHWSGGWICPPNCFQSGIPWDPWLRPRSSQKCSAFLATPGVSASPTGLLWMKGEEGHAPVDTVGAEPSTWRQQRTFRRPRRLSFLNTWHQEDHFKSWFNLKKMDRRKLHSSSHACIGQSVLIAPMSRLLKTSCLNGVKK